MESYSIWIEAESWLAGTWNIFDANSDVIVTFADGTGWIASFFTYANIQTFIEKNKRTGECLAGAYFWSSDMILIDEVSRTRIEEAIKDMIAQCWFQFAFKRISDAEDEHKSE